MTSNFLQLRLSPN